MLVAEAKRRIAGVKGKSLRTAGASVAWLMRTRTPSEYRPGVTVMTVNWNSLPFLQFMLDAVRASSPLGTEVLVVDNASSDGSLAYLSRCDDVRQIRLPFNFGHGVALDIG